MDFSNLFLNMSGTPYASIADAQAAGAAIIKYGVFINNVLDFVIVAFVIFMLVRTINQFKRKQEAAPPPPPPAEVQLLTEIRDTLKAQRG
jgi:large conductance mechanosensitive channel